MKQDTGLSRSDPSLDRVKGFIQRSGFPVLLALLLVRFVLPMEGGLAKVILHFLYPVTYIALIWVAVDLRRYRHVLQLSMIPAILSSVGREIWDPPDVMVHVHFVISLGASGVAIAVFLSLIYTSKTVTANTVAATLCVYMFFGTLWATIYHHVHWMDPEAFRGVLDPGMRALDGDFFYYSFVTLTTLGYGDITPVSTAAKHLSALEAVIGQFFLVVTVARIVGLYGSRIREPDQG